MISVKERISRFPRLVAFNIIPNSSYFFYFDASFKVKVGTEYAIHQKADGSLILIPKISNPYTSDAKFEDVPGPEREAWENMAMEELRRDDE